MSGTESNSPPAQLKSSVREFYRKKAPVYDRLAESFRDRDQIYVRFWLVDLARLIGSVRAVSGASILDIACGSGMVSLFLARKYEKIVCLDLTKDMLFRARENLSKESNRYSLMNADVDHLPFGEASFDVITCQRAFHHFPSPERALAEMRRVLRLGGQLAIGNPAFPENEDDAAFLDGLFRGLNPAFKRFHTASDYKVMLERSGFDRIRVDKVTRPVGAYGTIFVWTNIPATADKEIDEAYQWIREFLKKADPDVKARLVIGDESFSIPYVIVNGARPVAE